MEKVTLTFRSFAPDAVAWFLENCMNNVDKNQTGQRNEANKQKSRYMIRKRSLNIIPQNNHTRDAFNKKIARGMSEDHILLNLLVGINGYCTAFEKYAT